MSTEPDVIIVGAGAAGLSAAKELDRLGVSFTLVEGSHRIGGRAYSEEIAPGVWFDLGCSYLHQAENNPFVGIADTLGMTLARDWGDIFEDERKGLWRNGKPLSTDERQAYFAYADDSIQLILNAANRGADVVVADLLNLEHEFAPLFTYNLTEACAADLDLLSSADLASWNIGLDIPIRDGYGNLVARWGADVPVSLNTRVDRIDWSGKRVCVDTSQGVLRGKSVLITVSTNVLASGEVEFVPQLPGWKQDAVMNVPTGVANKICLHFESDVFGPEGRGYHNAWIENDVPSGFEASVMGLNTAIVFSGGRQASWLEKQGQKVAEAYALDQVASVFGEHIRQYLTRSIVTAWESDPWTRGTWSYALPGQAHQREALARPLDDCLFFAGEATTVGDQSTCHGAFNSGIRAAREISVLSGID